MKARVAHGERRTLESFPPISHFVRSIPSNLVSPTCSLARVRDPTATVQSGLHGRPFPRPSPNPTAPDSPGLTPLSVNVFAWWCSFALFCNLIRFGELLWRFFG
ncbi:hypothetical protein PanWU01x14_300930 [Parasponia andersonii]|uniref:Uncharacterized protein n=1 Tax=Parasponia andersonii TaxID=3476 RepID=A0A2P5ATS7_PARAD|nr:hypothetical protein PanWU01x14_300930 [Parasponia andersonii]